MIIMVNKFTKYFHIILFKKNHIVEQLRTINLNKLIRYYEILEKNIPKKNKLIMSYH